MGDGGAKLTAIFGMIGFVALAAGIGVSAYRASGGPEAREQGRPESGPGHVPCPQRGRRRRGPGLAHRLTSGGRLPS